MNNVEQDLAKVSVLRPRQDTKMNPQLAEIAKIISEAARDDLPTDGEQELVDDSSAFHKRFGFREPGPVRVRVIALRHRLGLTAWRSNADDEIRILRLAGALKSGRIKTTVRFERWLAAGGWLQIALFLSFMALQLVARWPASGLVGWQVLALFSFVAFVISFSCVLHQIYVRPWQILKRLDRH